MSIRDCLQAKADWMQGNKERLAQDDNLLGIGVGLKERNGRFSDELSVKYFVRTKKREGLGIDEMIPPRISDVATDVVQIAPLRARGSFTMQVRPGVGGCSGCVVIPGLNYTGTLGLGMRGYDSLADRTFILSNNHVLANENRAQIGDPVIQPGTLDGGNPQTDVIGELFDFVSLNFEPNPSVPNPQVNRVDAACALVHRFGDFSREIFWVGYPKGWRTRQSVEQAVADGNTRVQKTGRTTGYTTGEITAIFYDGWVTYDSGFAYFEDQMLITPGSFSDLGDSGSVILDMDENIVGLLFAGGATHTIANFIEDVWQLLSPIDFSDGIV